MLEIVFVMQENNLEPNNGLKMMFPHSALAWTKKFFLNVELKICEIAGIQDWKIRMIGNEILLKDLR